MRLVLLGTGLFAEELTDLAAEVPGVEVVAYAENLDRSKAGSTLLERPVVWFEELPALGEVCAVCAITTTRRERYIDEVRSLGIGFGRLVHPSAVVARTAQLGDGVVVGAGVVIGAQTTIGDHVTINRGALIGHHVSVGPLATIQPGAIIGGASEIGPRAYVALGARVLDRMSVGEGALVAAGAVVTRSVEPHVQVRGIPARPVEGEVTGR
jgi:sugar O-acyltransferase (sialic acid O-acetyltransferase NeuD family)